MMVWNAFTRATMDKIIDAGDNRRQQELHQHAVEAMAFPRAVIAGMSPRLADKLSGGRKFEDNLSAARGGVVCVKGGPLTRCCVGILRRCRPFRLCEHTVEGGQHDQRQ